MSIKNYAKMMFSNKKKETRVLKNYSFFTKWDEKENCFVTTCVEFEGLITKGKTHTESVFEMERQISGFEENL